MDSQPSIDHQLGQIFGKLEGIESQLKENKELHQGHHNHCEKITGVFNGRIDKLEKFNDKLTAKIAIVGVIAGGIVMFGKGIIVPIWHLMKGNS